MVVPNIAGPQYHKEYHICCLLMLMVGENILSSLSPLLKSSHPTNTFQTELSMRVSWFNDHACFVHAQISCLPTLQLNSEKVAMFHCYPQISYVHYRIKHR